MGLLETGEDKLQQSRTLQAGTLVIGASDTVTSQFLLPHLDAFHRRYPNIHIRIISGRSYKVLGLLRAGRVDIAFASAPGDADDLEHIPCFETHSCFVAAPDYPCDFTRAYTTEEIAAALDVEDDSITSLRLGGIVGHHEVVFGFPHQTVRISHDAIRREAFGTGAAFALRELATQTEPGYYTFEELLMQRMRSQWLHA